MQVVGVSSKRTASTRPLGVTLIALYELFIVGMIVYGVWIVFCIHFARSPGASGHDPLDEYNAVIFLFVPLSLISHLIAGVGLWFLRPAGRVVRMAISSVNVLAYMGGNMFIVVEYLPQHWPDRQTVFRVLALDTLIFCYLAFYPEIKKKFGRRAPV